MRKLLLIATIFILYSSCSKDKAKDSVVFDSSFSGARLDSVLPQGERKYIAYINPAFEPVNKSPWFAFGVSADTEKKIEVVLNYGKYKHRYIPKLSSDKKTWKKIQASKIKVDTANGTATLKLNVSPRKLFVAAQEIETSQDTYDWLDSILKTNAFLKKKVAGKTVKNENNYVITSNEELKKAIVLIARQHPPEIPGGTIGFKAFYEELLKYIRNSSIFLENTII